MGKTAAMPPWKSQAIPIFPKLRLLLYFLLEIYSEAFEVERRSMTMKQTMKCKTIKMDSLRSNTR